MGVSPIARPRTPHNFGRVQGAFGGAGVCPAEPSTLRWRRGALRAVDALEALRLAGSGREPDLTLKEQALQKVQSPKTKRVRLQPEDALLTFLHQL